MPSIANVAIAIAFPRSSATSKSWRWSSATVARSITFFAVWPRLRAEGDAPAEPPDAASLEALGDDELYLPFADAAAFQRMRNAAGRLVRRYVEEHASDLKRVWAVERPFELHVEDGTVSGRADVILDREGGEFGKLAIVDYKITEDTARDERYHQQLAVYASSRPGRGPRG